MTDLQEQLMFLLDYWGTRHLISSGRVEVYRIDKHNPGKWNHARSLLEMLKLGESLTAKEKSWVQDHYASLARN